MDRVAIAPVMQDQVAQLDAALRQLATDLGDAYTADTATLAATVLGPAAPCLALLATSAGAPVAATLAAPIFSTRLGGAGLFVSDLWVAAPARGQGLARRMLAATLQQGLLRDAGRFLKLTTYDDNPGARAVYDRLGFGTLDDETNLFLTGAALDTLREAT